MIVYNEPSEAYHANTALGSSLLRDFIKSPRLYRDRLDGLAPVKTTEAMEFGTNFHMAILEPERFAAETITKPDGMSFAIKEGKAWREQNGHLRILTLADSHKIACMQARMPANISKLLSNGHAEVTFRNVLAGIDAQCRADYLSKSGTFYDLKTINDIDKIDHSIFARGYHIQVRWYQKIIAADLSEIPQARLIFAETSAPFRWRVVLLDADYMRLADEAIDSALRGIAQCEKDGDWSDEQKEIYLASPPAWTQEFTENEEGGIDL